MNIRKRNLAIILAIIILVVVGLWLFVFRKPSQSNNQDNNSGQSSSQAAVANKACDVFSIEDAKSIFGNNISKLPPPENEAVYTSSDNLQDAPRAETESSTCTYVKGEVSSVDPVKKTSNTNTRTDIEPAPEGSEKPVDSTESMNQIKKENPEPTNPVQILANIALHTSTVENAKADFNRAKAKTSKEINGLGDSSFSIQVIGLSGKKQLALTMFKGKTLINITGENMNIKTAKKIAEVVLSKL